MNKYPIIVFHQPTDYTVEPRSNGPAFNGIPPITYQFFILTTSFLLFLMLAITKLNKQNFYGFLKSVKAGLTVCKKQLKF